MDPFVREPEAAQRARELQAAVGEASGVPAVDLLAHLEEVRKLLSHQPMGLFLDIDGTLAPIAPNPSGMSITAAVRQALSTLSRRMTVVALTGRSVEDARRIIGLDSLIYSGNHGGEWWERGSSWLVPEVERYVRQVSSLTQEANERLTELPGVVVQGKVSTLSLHYRQAVDAAAAREAILRFLDTSPEARGLVWEEGKMVVEVRPPVPVDKGTALRSVVERLGLRSGMVLGDDRTDLDSFGALQQLRGDAGFKGITVAVVGIGAPPKLLADADYHLLNTEAVELFLEWLVKTQPGTVEAA